MTAPNTKSKSKANLAPVQLNKSLALFIGLNLLVNLLKSPEDWWVLQSLQKYFRETDAARAPVYHLNAVAPRMAVRKASGRLFSTVLGTTYIYTSTVILIQQHVHVAYVEPSSPQITARI